MSAARTSLRLLLATSAAAGWPGCGSTPRDCTPAECRDGLQIELEPPSGGWQPGRYVLEIDADSDRTRCEGTLPRERCAHGPSLYCTGNPVIVVETGCDAPARSHALTRLVFPGSPYAVQVRLSRDGSPLASARYTPTYERSQPAGSGCPPVCWVARERLPPASG